MTSEEFQEQALALLERIAFAAEQTLNHLAYQRMVESREWLRQAEAAEYLGWSVRKLRQLTRVGAIPCRYEGRHPFYRKSDLHQQRVRDCHPEIRPRKVS